MLNVGLHHSRRKGSLESRVSNIDTNGTPLPPEFDIFASLESPGGELPSWQPVPCFLSDTGDFQEPLSPAQRYKKSTKNGGPVPGPLGAWGRTLAH